MRRRRPSLPLSLSLSPAQVALTVGGLFVGLFINIVTIAAATAALQTLDAKRGHVLKRLALIRRFLARSDVPEGLQRQVLDFFTYRLSSSQQAMHEIGSDLAGLPRELSLRLTMALYGDLLQHCPFFRPLSSSAVVALVQQLQPMVCMPGQLLVEVPGRRVRARDRPSLPEITRDRPRV